MEYPYDDWVPGVQIVQPRSGRRQRMAPQHGYWQGETLVVPGSVHGQPLHRSASTGSRPANIIINNEMDQHQESRSRSRDRRRSRSRHRYRDESSSDSDWDEREHERRDRRRPRSTSTRGPRTPDSYADYKTQQRLEKLAELERMEEKKKQEEQIKQEMMVKKAKADLEEAERKKKEDELRKKAIEDYNREQAEKALKMKKEKEESERLFEEKVRARFLAAGYTEDEALRVLKGKREVRETKELDVYDNRKTTYVKVHRKYLLPETLEAHHLPWEWDERDGNYIIIKRWIDKEIQDDLFEHTRKIKERKLIAYETPKEQKDKLYIVRKKSPSRRSWMFT